MWLKCKPEAYITVKFWGDKSVTQVQFSMNFYVIVVVVVAFSDHLASSDSAEHIKKLIHKFLPCHFTFYFSYPTASQLMSTDSKMDRICAQCTKREF